MAQPAASQVHLNVPLTNFSLAYLQEPSNFIASQVFPFIPVEHKSNLYYIWNKNDWFRDQMQPRADGDESAGSGFTLSNTPYACQVFALHKDVGYQELANADAIINLERATSRWLTRQALIRLERQWASDFFTSGKWGTDITGVASSPSAGQTVQWSNKSTSDPRNDIEVGKVTVLQNTGLEPNTLVLGYQSFQALKQHPDLRSQLQYTTPNSITPQMIGAMFEIPRVFVAKSVYASNNEGETAAYSLVQGKGAWLGYVDPNPGPETASAGYSFVWTGVSQGLGEKVAIGSFYIPQTKVQRYEIEMAWANQVIAADLGYMFNSIVA